MAAQQKERARQKHGWFIGSPRSYARLLKAGSVKKLAESYTLKALPSNLYCLEKFLGFNNLSPTEFLSLPDLEVKECIRNAIMQKRREGHYAQARKIFYVIRRFLELNEREVHFKYTQKKVMLKQIPTKNGECIPTREEIYRMSDAFPDKGKLQRLRGQAIILSLWQSGVRSSCLCSWVWGMFKDNLWPLKEVIPIKVHCNRNKGTTDCAEDTKLSSYSVKYYYTFLNFESAKALKDYLEERKAQGWIPKDSDPVFVTEGTIKETNGRPLTSQHINEIVKNGAKQIGIEPRCFWTHCLRKSFRKTLYESGIDNDICEGLMGHKLPNSRSSYYDYHDVNFARKFYIKGNWSNVGHDRILQLEQQSDEIATLKREHEELKGAVKALIAGGPATVTFLTKGHIGEGERAHAQEKQIEDMVKKAMQKLALSNNITENDEPKG